MSSESETLARAALALLVHEASVIARLVRQAGQVLDAEGIPLGFMPETDDESRREQWLSLNPPGKQAWEKEKAALIARYGEGVIQRHDRA